MHTTVLFQNNLINQNNMITTNCPDCENLNIKNNNKKNR